jgi:uncharacterized protein (TIGR02145 family)
MKKKLTYLLLLIFYELWFPVFCFSQGEWNNWIFGTHAGINFNSGIPVPITTINPSFWATHSSATASDSAGNLLFYASCSMTYYVYNSNNDTMPNGFLYSGNDAYAVQPYFVVQNLTDDSSYYLFSVRSPSILFSGLFYSLINMRLDGGLGDIVPGEKMIPILSGNYAGDVVTGTRHHNNKDVWIVTRNRHNSYKYLSYLITTSGIDTTPVQSQSTVYVNGNSNNQISFIRISPDGTKLVCLYDTAMEYCSFNSITGVITPLFHVKCPNGNVNQSFVDCGAEWSVDNKYFYITCQCGSSGERLFQFDATKTDSALFKQSEVLISSDFRNASVTLQRGSDNKIYLPRCWLDTLDVINNPSIQGLGCNFQKDAVCLLPGNITYDGFPQFLQRYKVYIHHTGFCQDAPVDFSADIWPPPDSLGWNFGDPASGGMNLSNLPTPSHTYSNTGTYTIELFVRHIDKRTDTAWQTITILSSPQVNLGANRTICNGDSTTFDAGTCSGCTYQWKNLGTNLIVGTGQTYKTGLADSYSVIVTNSNNCSSSDTVQLFTTPVPSVTNNPLSKSICSGDSTHIILMSNVSGTIFHWTASLTSGNITGFSADSGLGINQVLINSLSTSGVVTYHITPKVGSCAGTTVNFPVTVTPGDSVKVSITASTNNVCAGTPVTFTATPTNPGTTPIYLWKVNGLNSGTNSTTFTYTPINGDIVTCILTSSITACISNNPATSNTITMVVNPNLPVSITITASANPVCQGSSVTYTGAPVNGAPTPSFQWKVNGVNAGTNSQYYTDNPNNGDIVTCVLTSNAICATGNPATSNAITMTVNPNQAVSITISASANPFCQGSSVTYTATPVNGGGSPGYQWQVNGINVGTNSSTYTYNPSNGDLVLCILTSGAQCTTGNPATSNIITMIVNSNLPAGVNIATSSNPFCPGSSVTFSATPINGGTTPTYQWKVNGMNSGTNSHIFTYNPANGDSVRCVMTSNLGCVTNNPASSAEIIMNGTLAPIVTFTVCFDTITTVNAKPIKLKGGTPLGGTYSGPGVNSLTGVFTPSVAGVGTKTITYTYTNAAMCSANKSIHIIVQAAPAFTCGNNITDIRDNKVYPTVQIGAQCWLAANLNYGTIIASTQDQRDNCVSEKYCYNDNPINCTNQGGLYQWDELMLYDDTPGDQGFCPPAWHIPTENDWNTLFANYVNNGFAGSPLKYAGYSGFNALLSGARHIDKSWDFQGFATFFWSSSSYGGYKAWAHGMNDLDPSVSVYPASRVNAFSVRCLHD